MAKFQALRGMNDILPEEVCYWNLLENCFYHLTQQYGYLPIRLPIVESTDLFLRSIGEVTDIVEKEMYSFEDRHESRSISLRPEGTAGCVRAAIEHGLIYNKVQKLWYSGPLFRHERPQKGRYRQFHQLGMEAFGFSGPEIEAELLMLIARLWKQLNISDFVKLEINSLGSLAARAKYRAALVDYLNQNRSMLDEDSIRRLELNPLRILDSKNPALQSLITEAPSLLDYLDEHSKTHFETLLNYLNKNNISYTLNTRLVRGLDYYSDTVFEWVTPHLGAQATICAGGRYDGLVEILGGQATPAVGFALGCERVIELIKLKHSRENLQKDPQIYLIYSGEGTAEIALSLSEKLRDRFSNLRMVTHLSGGSFKNQFKKADQSKAEIALILGENEVTHQMIQIKYLRENREQQAITQNELFAFIKDHFKFD